MPASTGSNMQCKNCGADVFPAMARCRECGIVLIESKVTIGPGDLPPPRAEPNVTGAHQSAAKRSHAEFDHGPVQTPAPGDSLGTFDLNQVLKEAGMMDTGDASASAGQDTATGIESLTPAPPTRVSSGAVPPVAAGSGANADGVKIRLTCKQCGRDVHAPRSLAGKRVKCPTCGTSVLLPGDDREPRAVQQVAALDRHTARARLEEAIEQAVALRAHAVPSEHDRPALSSRQLRRARRAMARITGNRRPSGAQLQHATETLEMLAMSGDAGAGEVIVEQMLNLPDAHLILSIRALGDLIRYDALEPLLRTLVDGIEPVVATAIQSLGRRGDARATVPLAIVAAGYPEQHVRALEALTQLSAAALPALYQLVAAEPQPAIRNVVAEALGRIKDPRAATPLLRLVKDDDAAVRRSAVAALAGLGQRAVLKPLVAALGDPDEDVRIAAARGLAENPDRSVAPFLARMLKDASRDVRLESVHALGFCQDPVRTADLKPLLNCGDEELELAAVEAVARLGDRTALPRLLEMLDQATGTEADERWACRIIDALRRLKDERAVLPLIDLLTARSDRVRTRAAEALGAIGDVTALEPLAERIPVELSPTAQVALVKALGELKDPAALPALNRALEGSDPVRCKVIAALADIGGPDAVRLIVDQLDSKSGPVRYQAVTALGRIGSQLTIPCLEPLAGDADELVRRAAIKSLHALGDKRSEADLLGEFRRPEAAVRPGRPFRLPALRGVSWQSLVPNAILGLATGRQWAVIAGGLAAIVLIGVGLIVGGPFSGGGDQIVPRGFVESVSFSGDGQTVAAGRGFGRIEIWEVGTKTLKETVHFANGKFVAQDAAGRLLLVGDEQHSGIYDLTSKQPIVEESGIRSLTVNVAQTRAASEAVDGRVIIWNLEKGQIDARLAFDSSDTSAFAVSPDGSRCAVGTSQGSVVLIDMQGTQDPMQFALPAAGPVSGLGFSEDGSQLAVGDGKGMIYLWPVDAAEPAATLNSGFPEPIKALKFVDANRLVALRGLSIDQWDIGAKTSSTIQVPLETANAFAVDRAGKRAAVGSSEESAIIVFDLASGEAIGELDQALE